MLRDTAIDLLGRFIWIFMLPHANNFPSCRSQASRRVPIAFLILFDLSTPELGIGFRLRSVNWTAMPKTTIDENRHFRRSENNVCLPVQILDGSFVKPKTESPAMKRRTKCLLGSSVSWFCGFHSFQSCFGGWSGSGNSLMACFRLAWHTESLKGWIAKSVLLP